MLQVVEELDLSKDRSRLSAGRSWPARVSGPASAWPRLDTDGTPGGHHDEHQQKNTEDEPETESAMNAVPRPGA